MRLEWDVGSAITESGVVSGEVAISCICCDRRVATFYGEAIVMEVFSIICQSCFGHMSVMAPEQCPIRAAEEYGEGLMKREKKGGE